MILFEYQNIKTYLEKATFQISLKIVIMKTFITVPWTYVISDLKGEEIVWTIYEKELQKINKKEFRFEKVIKRKSYKLYVIVKGHDCSFRKKT